MNRKEALDALSINPGWHMATAGQGQNGCVEINLAVPGVVGVRDSKLPEASPFWRSTAQASPVCSRPPGPVSWSFKI
jgi:hypothetical protein